MQERELAASPSAATTDPDVIVIHGKRFVSGLYWKPLISPRNFMREVREIGKQNHWEIVAIRRTVRIQAGFVSKQSGALKGMYSLAATLAGQLGQSWIGAFALGDGRYAVAAAHEGSIVPGYDMVCTREQALAQLRSGVSLFQFDGDQIYAPADFAFARREASIYELLQPRKLKSEYRLKQLGFGLTLREIMALALLALAIAGAAFSYGQYRESQMRQLREQQVRRERMRQDQLRALNEKVRKHQSMAALAHPWAAMPGALSFITECKAAMDAAPLSVAGWLLSSMLCAANRLEIRYRRQPFSTHLSFQEHARKLFAQQATFEEKGEGAVISIPLNLTPGGDEPLRPANQLLTELRSRFQSLETSLDIRPTPAILPRPPATAPGEPEIPPPVPDWEQFSFQYDSPIAPPLTYLGALSHQDGLRILQIKQILNAEAPTFKWTVSGELYAKK